MTFSSAEIHASLNLQLWTTRFNRLASCQPNAVQNWRGAGLSKYSRLGLGATYSPSLPIWQENSATASAYYFTDFARRSRGIFVGPSAQELALDFRGTDDNEVLEANPKVQQRAMVSTRMRVSPSPGGTQQIGPPVKNIKGSATYLAHFVKVTHGLCFGTSNVIPSKGNRPLGPGGSGGELQYLTRRKAPRVTMARKRRSITCKAILARPWESKLPW